MRVIVTGSRNWDGVYGQSRIYQVLNIILALNDVLGVKLTLVHGDCPTGADRATDNWGRRREADGVTVETHPARWDLHQKRAGPLRNQEMVGRGADLCIGFIRDRSDGTQGTLALARDAGIPTFAIYWEEEVE